MATLPSYESIAQRHRWLFGKSTGTRMYVIEFGTGLDIGPGWLPLVDRTLTDIGNEVRALPAERGALFCIVQIKEKYGELCIYAKGSTKRINDLFLGMPAELRGGQKAFVYRGFQLRGCSGLQRFPRDWSSIGRQNNQVCSSIVTAPNSADPDGTRTPTPL